jgi:ATP-dependent Clp protease ATP-binding subunit ClpA
VRLNRYEKHFGIAYTTSLVHAAKDLSRQFDAIENAIDTIDDVEIRTRLKHSAKLSRATRLKAMLNLSNQIQKVVNHLGA